MATNVDEDFSNLTPEEFAKFFVPGEFYVEREVSGWLKFLDMCSDILIIPAIVDACLGYDFITQDHLTQDEQDMRLLGAAITAVVTIVSFGQAWAAAGTAKSLAKMLLVGVISDIVGNMCGHCRNKEKIMKYQVDGKMLVVKGYRVEFASDIQDVKTHDDKLIVLTALTSNTKSAENINNIYCVNEFGKIVWRISDAPPQVKPRNSGRMIGNYVEIKEYDDGKFSGVTFFSKEYYFNPSDGTIYDRVSHRW